MTITETRPKVEKLEVKNFQSANQKVALGVFLVSTGLVCLIQPAWAGYALPPLLAGFILFTLGSIERYRNTERNE